MLKAELDTTRADLVVTRKDLHDMLVERSESERERQQKEQEAAPGLIPEQVFVLTTKLYRDGKYLKPGELLPFNPENPPEGCAGLEEGVHYERRQVYRARH